MYDPSKNLKYKTWKFEKTLDFFSKYDILNRIKNLKLYLIYNWNERF